MPRGSSAGHTDDFLPGLPPWTIGLVAGVLVWAMFGLLVQGVGALVWSLALVLRGDEPIPIWISVTLIIVVQLGAIVVAVAAGRRATRWVAARRGR